MSRDSRRTPPDQVETCSLLGAKYATVLQSDVPATRLGIVTSFEEPRRFLENELRQAGVPGGAVVVPWDG